MTPRRTNCECGTPSFHAGLQNFQESPDFFGQMISGWFFLLAVIAALDEGRGAEADDLPRIACTPLEAVEVEAEGLPEAPVGVEDQRAEAVGTVFGVPVKGVVEVRLAVRAKERQVRILVIQTNHKTDRNQS